MANFINLTPHAITVVDAAGVETIFPASGQQARVSSSFAETVNVDGFNLNRQLFGEVTGLPEPVEGTIFIVSGMVLGQTPGRPDVVAPRTDGTAVRNEKQQIVAVRGFV